MLSSRPSLQDPESFSSLYLRTHLIIFRYIYGLHGGPVEEVEDLTCDTYLRAWKGRNRFSGGENEALSWLFTIARHLVIDVYRRKQVHLEDTVEWLDGMGIDEMILSYQSTPEEESASREQFKLVWKGIQSLPADKREMLVLRYILGWQVRQIAEFLRMEENTVSVYIHRGLEQIHRQWPIE
jgi:RNA polymerase sigma-70 factor (ECF subfamily)